MEIMCKVSLQTRRQLKNGKQQQSVICGRLVVLKNAVKGIKKKPIFSRERVKNKGSSDEDNQRKRRTKREVVQ